MGGAQRGGEESVEVAGVGMDGSPVGLRVSVRLAIPSPPPPSSFLETVGVVVRVRVPGTE